MFRILEKTPLNSAVTKLVVEAPLVARKAQPGQFVILRGGENSERIPLTVADWDRERGSVTVIFQAMGSGTLELAALPQDGFVHDFVGPLGRPSELENLEKVCVVGGGVGCAIALPVARALHERGTTVHSVVGFRSQELVILEEEFRRYSGKFLPMSDDGSWGEKGLVTAALESLISAGETYDKIIAIGPLVMMKFVTAVAVTRGIPVVVSMNPIMIDGTGMCGCCRLTVGGQTKFACVDGPEFDGALVDFDEAMHRGSMYRDFEGHAREASCNLLAQEVE